MVGTGEYIGKLIRSPRYLLSNIPVLIIGGLLSAVSLVFMDVLSIFNLRNFYWFGVILAFIFALICGLILSGYYIRSIRSIFNRNPVMPSMLKDIPGLAKDGIAALLIFFVYIIYMVITSFVLMFLASLLRVEIIILLLSLLQLLIFLFLLFACFIALAIYAANGDLFEAINLLEVIDTLLFNKTSSFIALIAFWIVIILPGVLNIVSMIVFDSFARGYSGEALVIFIAQNVFISWLGFIVYMLIAYIIGMLLTSYHTSGEPPATVVS